MILGMTPFTFMHVVLSLVGIVAGFVAMYGLFTAKPLPFWTAVFLITTVATSVTGFFFPFERFLPSHAVGVISLVVLAVAVVARYLKHLTGAWRKIYGVSAIIALYLNFFVLVVQLFQKVPVLHALAPNQSELPFVLTQVVVLILFIVLAIGSVMTSRKSQAES